MNQAHKVAVVTGGARSLGQAYAYSLAQAGIDIVIADIDPAEETERLVRSAGAQAVSYRCDVSSEQEVDQLAQAVQERFGQCDILINNAGVSTNRPFDDLDFKEWRRTLSINLDSMFLTCKAFVPGMKRQRYGRIINVSSNTFGLVIGGFVHYVTSKGGVIGFTRALATELGPFGITVNALAPGLTSTPFSRAAFEGTTHFDDTVKQQAIKRVETPDDLAGVVSFLISDAAAFITGQTLVVDG
ncbi:MAG: SDR family oxidoreductase, partial [Chloroflexi bacterium]|nr:SDR family oxidoreductase [Chloroflexota bacterium]